MAISISFISCFLLLHSSLSSSFYWRFHNYLEFLTLPPPLLPLLLPILHVDIKFKDLRGEQASLRAYMCPKTHWCRTFFFPGQNLSKRERERGEREVREKLLKSLFCYILVADNSLRRVQISAPSFTNPVSLIYLSLCVHIFKTKTIPSSSSCLQWDNTCECLIHDISRNANALKGPNTCSKERLCSKRLSKKLRMDPLCRGQEKTAFPVRHRGKGREFCWQ